MSDAKSGLPWTSLAVLAAFVMSTQLVPHVFEPLRPPEKERAQAAIGSQFPIDARLWEDPFAALRRYESERNERCEKRSKAPQDQLDCRQETVNEQLRLLAPRDRGAASAVAATPASLAAPEKRGGSEVRPETLVLAALVPGNPFVGAEESRRRTRYAILAGLQSVGYVPTEAERLGLLSVPRAELLSGAEAAAIASTAIRSKPGNADQGRAPALFQLPFEQFELSAEWAPKAGNQRYRRVLLLWIDESALPQPKLNALALLAVRLLGVRSEDQPGEPACQRQRLADFAVIGPSSTDALRTALADLDRASLTVKDYPHKSERGQCLATRLNLPAGHNDLRLGYAELARTRFFSAASTAPARFLSELGAKADVDDFLSEQFGQVLEPLLPMREGQRQRPKISFTRTIATDDLLIKRLVNELQQRLSPTHRQRIVLVAERDSRYAQALVAELRSQLTAAMPGEEKFWQLQVMYYFRGLDGVTGKDSGGGTGDKPAPPNANDASRIEWPEARDQLDYLRRMAGQLQRSEMDRSSGFNGRISAIGVIGFDVHDKLLVLQALHDSFSDKVFFTTDMDARLLHPRALPFTRNLIVASSLPLELPLGGDAGTPDLRQGTPPLRDSYQTASYLAARSAACADDNCRDAEARAVAPMLKQPRLYELGRSRAVGLDAASKTAEDSWSERWQGRVAGLLFGLLLTALFVWPSTPALRALRLALSKEGQGSLRASVAAICAMHIGVLGLVASSLRGFVSASPATPLAMGVMALGLSLLSFAILRSALALKWFRRMHLRVGVLALLACGLLLVQLPLGGKVCTDCEPLLWFEGVSAWPSLLLQLAALVVLVLSWDLIWDVSLNSLAEDSDWLQVRPQCTAQQTRSWAGGLRRLSVLRWPRPDGLSCDFQSLWTEYALRGAPLPRGLRILAGFLLSLVLGATAIHFFSQGSALAIPVRGATHRELVGACLYLVLLLLPMLIMAAADATLLACRFVQHLNKGRSVYPPTCIKRFALSLGAAQAPQWQQGIAALPQQRLEKGRTGDHSLLDDWLDMQLIARRTATVAPLVIGPFVVLAILLVARSRVFDNWSINLAVAVAASAFLLWLMLMSALLKHVVEQARSRALASMQADLRWLRGAGADWKDLIQPFEKLIEQVRDMRAGAFAGFFEQPLLRALLVPLGSAGGAQLLEYLASI
ncbi:hypothetical protein RQP53_01145 [Paucibacter sp. APW11]|uniref:IcmF-related N-terminal domain-containing protein n=1 Tax=Roseateles aquae TaxID=3077235 RepID=A0ABU3P6M8_9BURK|nr:hypothetical protein [Paucibacter sp. APW11]MDT8997875.1 hypothetical protein [Paucibacter sp. APW11]